MGEAAKRKILDQNTIRKRYANRAHTFCHLSLNTSLALQSIYCKYVYVAYLLCTDPRNTDIANEHLFVVYLINNNAQ